MVLLVTIVIDQPVLIEFIVIVIIRFTGFAAAGDDRARHVERRMGLCHGDTGQELRSGGTERDDIDRHQRFLCRDRRQQRASHPAVRKIALEQVIEDRRRQIAGCRRDRRGDGGGAGALVEGDRDLLAAAHHRLEGAVGQGGEPGTQPLPQSIHELLDGSHPLSLRLVQGRRS